MASINKRLRYFSTEQEYQAFYNQQKQACDDGTLELLETTVCCITHGDPDTPDEYLPSHDAGDEDKLMHYNVNDEIRYIPFFNPMWTIRGCYLSEVSGGGFEPILVNSGVSLPDIIDGQQITKLGEYFTPRISSFPNFSVKNISVFLYKSYRDFRVTSDWPSLTTLNVSMSNDNDRPDEGVASAPVFENGILNAPMLRVVNYTAPSIGSINRRHKISDIPLINSSIIENFSVYTNSELIDIGEIMSTTENLRQIALHSFYDDISSGVKTHTVRMKYDGNAVSCPLIILDGTDTDGEVSLDITGNVQKFNLSRLCLYNCDINKDQFTIKAPTTLYFNRCYSSSLSLVSCTDWLSHGGGTIKTNLVAGGVTYRSCDFTKYIIDAYDDGAYTGSGRPVVIAPPSGVTPDVVINVGMDNLYLNYSNTGSANTISFNIADQDMRFSTLIINGSANKLVISDNTIKAFRLDIVKTIPVDNKMDWYYSGSGSSVGISHSTSSRVLDMFRVTAPGFSVNISDVLESLDLVVRSDIYNGQLMLSVNNEINECNIDFLKDEEDHGRMSVITVFFGKDVSVQTVVGVLSAVDPAFSLTWTGTASQNKLTIYDTQYTAIEQGYPSAFATINKFKTVDRIIV